MIFYNSKLIFSNLSSHLCISFIDNKTTLKKLTLLKKEIIIFKIKKNSLFFLSFPKIKKFVVFLLIFFMFNGIFVFHLNLIQ